MESEPLFSLNDLDFSSLKKPRRIFKTISEKRNIKKVSAEYQNRKIVR